MSTLAIPDDYAARRGLVPQREATELVLVGRTPDGREVQLTPGAARAWNLMCQEAAADGIALVALSGFRSIERQRALIEAKLSTGQGMEDILTTVAAPGYSEHHTGCAVDVAVPDRPTLTEAFAGTPAFRWLEANAGRFGCRLSYPQHNAQGFVFEPWHWYFQG